MKKIGQYNKKVKISYDPQSYRVYDVTAWGVAVVVQDEVSAKSSPCMTVRHARVLKGTVA